MNEIITYCPNCGAGIYFVSPIDDARLKCEVCGLRMYGKNRVERFSRIARDLSRGIAPKSRGINR